MQKRILGTLSLVGLMTTLVVVGVRSAQADVPAAPATINVGLITDGPTVDDAAFNWFSYQGLLRAESELGATGTVYTSTSAADFGPNLQQCVDDGNALCIAVGFGLADAISSTAIANPGTFFAIACDPKIIMILKRKIAKITFFMIFPSLVM